MAAPSRTAKAKQPESLNGWQNIADFLGQPISGVPFQVLRLPLLVSPDGMETQRTTIFVRGNDEAEGRIWRHRTQPLIQGNRQAGDLDWLASEGIPVVRKNSVRRNL